MPDLVKHYVLPRLRVTRQAHVREQIDWTIIFRHDSLKVKFDFFVDVGGIASGASRVVAHHVVAQHRTRYLQWTTPWTCVHPRVDWSFHLGSTCYGSGLQLSTPENCRALHYYNSPALPSGGPKSNTVYVVDVIPKMIKTVQLKVRLSALRVHAADEAFAFHPFYRRKMFAVKMIIHHGRPTIAKCSLLHRHGFIADTMRTLCLCHEQRETVGLR